MNLLLDDIDVLATSGDPAAAEVTGVEHDSRRAGPGTLFCCLPGRHDDGHRHAAEAAARGASGVVCERPLPSPLPPHVVQVRVAPGHARLTMARLAAAFYGQPAHDLVMVGVTGTNGKTTVTHLVGAVTAFLGHPTTVLGTLSGTRTTPEANDLQRTLASVRDGAPPGTRPVVVMEVSSHALAQHRVDAIVYDVAAFTNLSHDHLDFHESMEQYFCAKAALFDPQRSKRAVVDVDGEWGARLFGSLRIPGIAVRSEDVTDVRLALGHSAFRWRGQEVQIAMSGMVNVRNAHLAAEVSAALGVAPADVAAGLRSAHPVPGRLERVTAPGLGDVPTVLVDYAHTPAALEVVLGEARRLVGAGQHSDRPAGRVLVVFGCGGERDRAKRPLMGEVAARLADRVVVTSDNPRGEDPDRIIDQVLAGVAPSPREAQRSGTLVVEPDRRRAIGLALDLAEPQDVILVAGKGHETYQELGEGRVSFDDRVVAAEALVAAGRARVAAGLPGAAGPPGTAGRSGAAGTSQRTDGPGSTGR